MRIRTIYAGKVPQKCSENDMKAQVKGSPSQLKLDTKLLLQPILEDRISAKVRRTRVVVRTFPLDYAGNYSALSKGKRLERKLDASNSCSKDLRCWNSAQKIVLTKVTVISDRQMDGRTK